MYHAYKNAGRVDKWTNVTEELQCNLVTTYYLGFQIVSDVPVGYITFLLLILAKNLNLYIAEI